MNNLKCKDCNEDVKGKHWCDATKTDPLIKDRKLVLTIIDNWCRFDSESSFNPNSSAWRLYDFLKERLKI